jgi:predicted ATPase/class 3 adenylate cyclase
MGRDLPSGTVSFFFTDVEGSTRLQQDLGPAEYAEALAKHRRILRNAVGAHGGVEVDTQGDALFVAFPTAPGALAAATEAMKGLAEGPIRVRMGIHTGTPYVAEEGYVGIDVHRAARIAASGHGGQVLVSASTASLLPPEALRDLGLHRLKDLSAPERIYQLVPEDFPPLRSLYRTNLPIPATPFVGRKRELTDVLQLLEQDDVRLLSLTGPGGTGKTRLSLQAAAEAAERFPDGVFWTALAPLRDPRLVLAAAARALDAGNVLAEHIADKSLLLLFDNFEHVVEAAGGLPELLATCPNLKLLVTSRELLGVPGEQAYPVPPLEPDDGTELFLARARAALPGFVSDEAVPELCTRLEQLPLALELAAARVRVISPGRLLDRLSSRLDLLKAGRGADPRQRTLRATIEWSYELLTGAEQELFARLAVFAGGWTLETAEKVCDADLDALQSLVDKSLVRVRVDDRFWMLETIREYASERLDESAAAGELRRHHAEFFLALAEETAPNLIGRGSRAEWLDALEREHDNLRTAIDWFEASGESDRVLRFAAALWRFWDGKGHLVEGRRRVESALGADDHPTAARAKALSGAADMALTGGDIATGGRRAREALGLHRKLGDPWGAAFSQLMVAYATGQEGDWPRAQQLFGDSLRRFRELGDEHYALRAARAHAWAYYEGGDLERARELYREIVDQARELHDPFPEAVALGYLSNIALDQGRLREAVPLAERSYRIANDLGDLLWIAYGVCRFALALSLAGRPETAARVLSCSAALHAEIGAMPPYVANMTAQTLAAVRPELDEAAFAVAWAEGEALTADEAVALALATLDDRAPAEDTATGARRYSSPGSAAGTGVPDQGGT